MIPLLIFLLACVAIYLGTIEAAFSALMRLSLRLLAERSDRPGTLGAFLDNPLLLLVPVRFLLGLVIATATALLARAIGVDAAHTVTVVVLSVVTFVVVCELLVPVAIVFRNPERVLELLLPSFTPVARALRPISKWIGHAVALIKREQPGSVPAPDVAAEEAKEAPRLTATTRNKTA